MGSAANRYSICLNSITYKVITVNNFNFQATTNAAEIKKLQSGDLEIKEAKAVAAVKNRFEMEGLKTEEANAMLKVCVFFFLMHSSQRYRSLQDVPRNHFLNFVYCMGMHLFFINKRSLKASLVKVFSCRSHTFSRKNNRVKHQNDKKKNSFGSINVRKTTLFFQWKLFTSEKQLFFLF